MTYLFGGLVLSYCSTLTQSSCEILTNHVVGYNIKYHVALKKTSPTFWKGQVVKCIIIYCLITRTIQ